MEADIQQQQQEQQQRKLLELAAERLVREAQARTTSSSCEHSWLLASTAHQALDWEPALK
jgi:hypothetical protein